MWADATGQNGGRSDALRILNLQLSLFTSFSSSHPEPPVFWLWIFLICIVHDNLQLNLTPDLFPAGPGSDPCCCESRGKTTVTTSLPMLLPRCSGLP